MSGCDCSVENAVIYMRLLYMISDVLAALESPNLHEYKVLDCYG